MSAPAITLAAPANDELLWLSTVPQGGEEDGDAWIHGPLDPALLTRQLTLGVGPHEKAAVWENRAISFHGLVEKLIDFEAGTKDGLAILQGELMVSGSRRGIAMRAAHLLGFDIDSGITLEEVVTLLRSRGLCAVIWTTHSHNREKTFISERALTKWLKRQYPGQAPGKPTAKDVADYLIEKKKARASIFEGALLSDREHDAKGAGYSLTHRKWPRLRVLLLLDKPFAFLERGGTQDEAIAEWKAKYPAAAASLGLVVDTACKDPARLLFLPRISLGALHERDEPGAADIAVLPGKAFDLEAVHLPPKPERAVATGPAWEGAKTHNLSRFLAIGARSFRAADWLRQTAPEDVRHDYKDGRKIDARCPMEDAHTTPSDSDRGFYAINGNGDASGFHLYCPHATCLDAAMRADGKHDRGVMLDEACVYYGIDDAAELLPWCDDAARTEWARHPLEPFYEPSTTLVPVAQKAPAPHSFIETFDSLWRRAGAQMEIGKQSVAQQARAPQLPVPVNSAAALPAVQPQDLLEFAADIKLSDLLEDEANALVRGIMHLREQGCIYGVPGAGKSFIGLDLGFHVALGKDWHGRKVTRAPVLYICLEGVRGFRKRMYVAKERLGDPGHYFSRLNVHISLMREAAGAAGMGTIVAAAKALAEKCGQPVGMIVIDTLARAVSGDDENAVEDMMHYLEQRAGAIGRETGAHVLTVHHPNAEGKLRGSTSLGAAFDTVLRIDMDSSGRRTLVGQKVKDDQDGPLFDFELEKVLLGFSDDGQPASSCVVRTVARAAAEPEPKKGEKVFRDSFEALRTDGKLTECTATDGGKVGVRVHISELKDVFCKRYGTKNPDKAWRRTIAACPPGFVRMIEGEQEFIWFPL